MVTSHKLETQNFNNNAMYGNIKQIIQNKKGS